MEFHHHGWGGNKDPGFIVDVWRGSAKITTADSIVSHAIKYRCKFRRSDQDKNYLVGSYHLDNESQRILLLHFYTQKYCGCGLRHSALEVDAKYKSLGFGCTYKL